MSEASPERATEEGDEVSEPTTEAGRILLREHSSGTPHMARHIAAIEAEAREDEAERCAMHEMAGKADLAKRIEELEAVIREVMESSALDPDEFLSLDRKCHIALGMDWPYLSEAAR